MATTQLEPRPRTRSTTYNVSHIFIHTSKELCSKMALGKVGVSHRAQPDWTYECLTRTGPDTQICQTCPAGQD